jgi:hypothetical protein
MYSASMKLDLTTYVVETEDGTSAVDVTSF